jgi:fructose-1,6-bisphosphatase/inositol monophosphatase family enzyme
VVSSRDFLDSARSVVKDLVPLARDGAARTNKTVTTKRDGSLVTEIDQQVESRLISEFTRRFPGVVLLGEEGAIDSQSTSAHQLYGRYLASEYQITIDPIDGTKNFINGKCEYCIAVALSAASSPTGGGNGVWPVAGVIAVPEENALYWADEDSVFVEDIGSGNCIPLVSQTGASGWLSVNSRDRVWLAERNFQLLLPWISSGSSVYDLLGTVLGRNRASIIGSQRLWDLMAPLALALRSGLALRDLQSGEELSSIGIFELSDDIESRPWGLARKIILANRDLKIEELLRR